MKSPKASVIIPVYNTQQYLKDCIDSILKQTMQDFEIICVDDGSTDDSGLVLRKFANEDIRINVLSQKNMGLSAARNVGLKVARGEYIYFLDSDDYVESDMLEVMCREMEQEKLDIAFFDAQAFGEGTVLQEDVDSKNRYYTRKCEYSSIYTGEDLLYNLIKNGDYSCSVFKQLVRGSFLRDNQLRFYEGIIHEDELYTFQVMMLAERVALVPRVLYRRRVRENSIMTKPVSYQSAYGVFVFVKEAYKLLLQKKCSEEKSKCFLAYMKKMINVSRKRFVKLTATDRAEFEKLPEEEKFLFQICINDFVQIMDQRNEFAKRNSMLLQQKMAIVEKLESMRQNVEHMKQQKQEVVEKLEHARQQVAEVKQRKKEVVEKLEYTRQQVAEAKQQKKEVVEILESTKLKAEKLEKKLKEVKSGWSFRIGRALTYIPRRMRALLMPMR